MSAQYRIFGLNIAFPREVPTLNGARCPPQPHPDAQVIFGTVPERAVMTTVNDDLDCAWDENGIYIAVPEVGRFWISQGRQIIADKLPHTSDSELDLYLAGSIMGALLHQRSILPMHCNAFEYQGHAFLLCGDSGAGKSTLAAWFEGQGFALLTDDVCAVTFSSGGQALAHPGIPRLRLWQDALELTHRESHNARTIPWADGKYELEMGRIRAHAALPIAAIYHLSEAEEDTPFAITPLQRLNAMNAITRNIYRRRLADLISKSRYYLDYAVHLAQTTPIFAIDRTWGIRNFDTQAQSIQQHSATILLESAITAN